MGDIPRAVWEGSFEILGITLRCYVLDDGQRIINAEDLERFMSAMGETKITVPPDNFRELMRWCKGTA